MIVGHFNDVMSQIITPDKNLSLNKFYLQQKKKIQLNDATIVIKRGSEESKYICEYCENKPALCIDPCFRLHHSNLQIKIPDAVEDDGNKMV